MDFRSIAPAAQFAIGHWTHVVALVTGTNVSVYVDGIVRATATTGFAVKPNISDSDEL
jgi:hypothetical protein